MGSLHANGQRWEGIMQTLVKRVCNAHGRILQTQVGSYRNLLNVLLKKAQLRVEHAGGCCVSVGEEWHLIHIAEAASSIEMASLY